MTEPLPDCYKGGGATVEDQTTVPVTTLDKHCERNNVERIDLLKTDTQGYDLNMLRGADRLLSQQRIKLIYSEVVFTTLYQNQPLFYDVALFLQGHGYRFVDFYGKRRDEHNNLMECDALFAAIGG
ncbi:MAG TPA: FkbM family methyltransferase [Blastocatellia bacterium]|nr:FkbM family methyltransferase [Blastocatellia bacterium]